MTTLLNKKRLANADPDEDLTTHLMHCKVNDHYLNDEEIISILRNWTMGEVGTITNAIARIIHENV